MTTATPRISASSYSNTAPLVWSFLYGANRGMAEIILDNAPARSAELLAQNRVSAALTPVAAYFSIDDAVLVPDVCVGAHAAIKSVALVTGGRDLRDVRSVALDTSSRTSVVLTKIIFREFLAAEPEWIDAAPDVEQMLSTADAALLIGDPALSIADSRSRIGESDSDLRSHDLAELWHSHTGLGFIFAMWMTRGNCPFDFVAARDEGLSHVDDIVSNYTGELPLSAVELRRYLTEIVVYRPDEAMLAGMELYFELAEKHGLVERGRPIRFAVS